MAKKRWSLIFSALCLALVFSVSSVEAQEQETEEICMVGNFCDRDMDGFIRVHNRCMACLGMTDCDDSIDGNDCAEIESGTTFSVDVVEGSGGSNWVVTLGDCVGSSSSSNLSAGFSFPINPDCGPFTVRLLDGTGPTTVKLWLSQISVQNTKKGATVKAGFNAFCCPNSVNLDAPG